LSAGAVTNPPKDYFAVTPQVVNPSANIFTNSTNRTLISGIHAASGSEDSPILGNFSTNANTKVQLSGGTYNTDRRILPELTTDSTPPTAFTGLGVTIGEEMDCLIHRSHAPAPPRQYHHQRHQTEPGGGRFRSARRRNCDRTVV